MGCRSSSFKNQCRFALHRDKDDNDEKPLTSAAATLPVSTSVVFAQDPQAVTGVIGAIRALEDVCGRLSILLAMTQGKLSRSKAPARTRALETRVRDVRGQIKTVKSTIDTIRSTAASAVVTTEMVNVIRVANSAIRALSVDPDAARDVMQTSADAVEEVDELATLLSAPVVTNQTSASAVEDELFRLVQELDEDDAGRPVTWASGALETDVAAAKHNHHYHHAPPLPEQKAPSAGDAAAGRIRTMV